MTAPAGPCEWCGGPQNWTFIAGEMYVRCQLGCLPLEGLGLTPPDSDGAEQMAPSFEMEPEVGGSVVPLEGSDARMSVIQRYRLEGPPQAFLDSLWKGDCDAPF